MFPWLQTSGAGGFFGLKQQDKQQDKRTRQILWNRKYLESIARMMGHTNIDSTQVYAQVTDRKISSDMDRLMERRKPAAGKEAAG